MIQKKHLAVFISAAASMPVLAQGEAREIEEVMVTAQKREQSAQDIPMAVSAFNGHSLRAMGAVDSSSIVARTPGLGGGKDTDTQSVLTMRGVGTAAFAPGTDNSVGTYFNEVPVSRTIGSQGFLDVERVEVVKGPQGTLFGRNTSSGAISITNKSAELDENSLELRGGAGTANQLNYEVTANGALSENFALRFAGRHDERDGTFENHNGDQIHGRDHDQWRISVHWSPSDALDAKWFYEEFQANSFWAPVAEGQAFDDKVSVDTDVQQQVGNRFSVLNLTWNLNDTYSLTSNTGYLDSDNILSADVDSAAAGTGGLCELLLGAGPVSCVLAENWAFEQFTQDLRLNASYENFDWFIGTSYYREEVALDADLDLVFLPDRGLATNETTSYAVFGDMVWRATGKLSLTLGARYTIDEKAATVDNTQGALLNVPTLTKLENSDEWTSLDPRFAIDYAINNDLLLYFNYAKGFKAGGFNKQPNEFLGSEILSVDPERNDAYEVGLKADLWDGRARVNTALFMYDYSDFQVESTPNGSPLIFNAGDMQSRGLEVDGTFLLSDSLDLRLAYAYLDAEFKSGLSTVPLEGRRPLRAPENSFSAALTHTVDLSFGEISTRAEYTYTDEMNYHIDYLPGTSADAYGLWNASVNFDAADGKWGLSLIGENIADEKYIAASSFLLDPLVIPGMGALWRLEGRVRF